VNASPGFEGLEAATKQNIAKLFIEAAVRTARGRK
jgi:glutathione synthase/RimK-type ligase-like ATP-grasp enzyme